MSGILKNRSFLFVLTSHFIHKMAEQLYDLAIPLLILNATGSSVLMGFMYALGFVAEFLVGFFGGSIVDMMDRKKLLMIISALQALFISLLPISASLDVFDVASVFLVAFVLDLCIALYRVADTSIIPQLVEKRDLPRANGIMQMAISTAEATGPAVSGLIITALGLFASLWINVGAFLLLLSTLSLIRHYKPARETDLSSPGAIWSASKEGLRYTLSNNLFRSILVWNLFVNFGLSGAVLILLYHLKEVMNLQTSQIGIIMTMAAVGGLLSGLMFSRVQAAFRSGRILFVSSLVVSVSLLSIPFQEHWLFVGISVCFLMFCVGLNSRLIHLLFQTCVPEHMLGRVISASRLVSTLLAPLSVVLAGWVAEHWHPAHVFVGGAMIIVSATLASLMTNMPAADWSVREESRQA
ncbi:MFS transporter [Staphylospora marina]|uniref:MFS transporter n=1 Tax=Staphylospora marina TaxID=2490858 RepID=UPI0013DE51E7|nr:MFS transporter [Staphylospora marina]